MNRWKQVVALALGLAGGLVAGGAQAALLQVNAGGVLTGATGVVVDGALYDVTFDGRQLCADAFGDCNIGHVFTFTTQAGAEAASQALLDQVFTGVFDDSPNKTAGCESFNACYVSTPWQVSPRLATGVPRLSLSAALNLGSGLTDGSASITFNANLTYAQETNARGVDYAFALWTPSASSTVPEPTLPALLGMASAAWALTRRKASAAA